MIQNLVNIITGSIGGYRKQTEQLNASKINVGIGVILHFLKKYVFSKKIDLESLEFYSMHLGTFSENVSLVL